MTDGLHVVAGADEAGTSYQEAATEDLVLNARVVSIIDVSRNPHQPYPNPPDTFHPPLLRTPTSPPYACSSDASRNVLDTVLDEAHALPAQELCR